MLTVSRTGEGSRVVLDTLGLQGVKIGEDGILPSAARRFRTQEANRRDGLERCTDLIKQAGIAPKMRRRTRRPRSANERKLEFKRHASKQKEKRRSLDPEGIV